MSRRMGGYGYSTESGSRFFSCPDVFPNVRSKKSKNFLNIGDNCVFLRFKSIFSFLNIPCFMATNKGAQEPDNLKTVENVLSQSEAFIEKYQKQILYGVGIVVLVVLAILAFRNWYLVPRESKAETKLAVCQNYFAVDSFQVALNGDGTENCIGFKGVVDEYGMTNSANLANAYAGVCCYKLKDYNNAIKYLKKFNGKDLNIAPSITGLIGDSYVELGQVEEGIKYFLKAADVDNEMISPIYLKKAAIAYESRGDYKKAVEAYTKIKDQYVRSQEAADMDRYIARAQALEK